MNETAKKLWQLRIKLEQINETLEAVNLELLPFEITGVQTASIKWVIRDINTARRAALRYTEKQLEELRRVNRVCPPYNN